MKNTLFSTAALIAVSACAAAAQPNEPSPAPAYAARAECTIAIDETRNGLRFEALARSRDAASGEYEFVLTKEDGGGSSDIVQGGAFALNAGDESMLGRSELSLERNGRYRARLTLWDNSGEVCRAERRS